MLDSLLYSVSNLASFVVFHLLIKSSLATGGVAVSRIQDKTSCEVIL
jgi:hypothetical protein